MTSLKDPWTAHFWQQEGHYSFEFVLDMLEMKQVVGWIEDKPAIILKSDADKAEFVAECKWDISRFLIQHQEETDNFE